MSTYEQLRGARLKFLDQDPANASNGQVWYNSTTGKDRVSGIGSAAWVSSANLTTARYDTGGAGTQTANLIFGGYSTANTTSTEEYNGSGWSTGGALGTGRSGNAGAGTQTAGLSTGGVNPPSTYVGNTEEYNGTSWSEQNDLSTSRGYSYTGGSQTAAWIGGGRQGPPYSNPTATEEYDGTSWTAGGALGSGGYSSASSGPLSAGWAAGGSPSDGSGVLQLIQFYDGSSWTNGPNAPTAFQNATGSGTQTLCLSYGMQTPSSSPGVTSTYVYDGSSFSVSPATLATARRSAARAMGPSGTAAILAGGRNTPAQSLTEEYNFSTETITAAAWSSGPSLGTGRYQCNGQNVGSKTAGLITGGQGGDPATTFSAVEEWDGSSWTAGTALSNTRAMFGSVGTQTAAFIFGGYGKPGAGPNPAPGSPNDSSALNYDGSSWTSETSMPSALAYITGAGTQTAALDVGGFPALTTCSEYDGSSWTST